MTALKPQGSELVWHARTFAIAAHEAVGQRRKYTGEPYWRHPEHVASLVETVCGTSEMVAAAWLHDVVEDTEVTLDTLSELFGEEVAELVDWLTDRSRPEDGNRATRKRIDRDRLAQAPEAAVTIKLADLVSNTSSIAQHDPSFARIYLDEKRAMLEAMQGGASALRSMAEAALTWAQELVEAHDAQ